MNRKPAILVIVSAVILLLYVAVQLYPGTVRTPSAPIAQTASLHFRNSKLLMQHFEKHGKDMGFTSASEYEKAAAAAAANPNALHKIESDDGDDVYYVKATNEFVVVSTDGYIRTYFLPDSGIKYFNKQ